MVVWAVCLCHVSVLDINPREKKTPTMSPRSAPVISAGSEVRLFPGSRGNHAVYAGLSPSVRAGASANAPQHSPSENPENRVSAMHVAF